MPTSWTDLEPVDPYVALSSGRSFFQPEDLLAGEFNNYVELVRRCVDGGPSAQ